MAKETAFENGQISNFQGLVTLKLDRAILHTIMHHSQTFTYMPNFTEIKESFCGRTYVHGRTFETHFSTQKRRPRENKQPDYGNVNFSFFKTL